MDRRSRNRIVLDHLPLVRYWVSEVCGLSTNLPRDDLAAAGAIALIQAADSYDADRNVPFAAYAKERVIGGIRDEMRRTDWAKRAQRARINETRTAQEKLRAELGRSATVAELAAELGVSREVAVENLTYTERTVASLDESVADTLRLAAIPPESAVAVRERIGYLQAAIDALPANLRHVIEQLFLADRSVGELADELGVTHSAVSQQRAEALRLLRMGFTTHYDHTEGAEQPATRRQKSYVAEFGEATRAGVPLVAALTA